MDMTKLKSMKMPGKPMAEQEASDDLDLESLGESGAVLGEMEPEMGMGEEMGAESDMGSPMAEFSDDEIIEEMKMRGLSMDQAPAEGEMAEEVEAAPSAEQY